MRRHHSSVPSELTLVRRPVQRVVLLSVLAVLFSAACLSAQQQGVEAGGDPQAPAQPPAAAGLDPRLSAGRPTVTAVRLAEGEDIRLDGLLDEPVWQSAQPATDFIEQDPNFGGVPSERTEVRFVFNGESLYMGVYAFDSEPDKLLGNTMKRDEFLRADDRFMWTMDTFFDQQTGYFFEMNPSGLMADALMLAGGGNERAWDGIWDAYARRSDIGWTLEIELPFRTLNFDPNAPAWGVNFQRTVRRKGEESVWTGHERNQGLRRMSNAGLLLGIKDVTQGHGLDIKPYLAGYTYDAPGATPRPDRENSADVGVDLFYSVTPELKTNLTINTDFAQTEVDQRLVNLTQFPQRYPEKREFFLDGSAFFSFASTGTEPFFSRRIGLTGGVPQQVDVGTKLTGRAGAQDVGFLHVRTGEEGERNEPGHLLGEDFTVLRVKRRVLAQSYLGSFVSRRHTRNPTTSVDDRYTAGVDFRLATSSFRGSDQVDLSGFLLWNSVAENVSDNLGYGLALSYPNEPWTASAGFTEIQPNHDPAIGFTPRKGFRRYNPSVTFGPRPANHPWIRQLTFGAGTDFITDMENDLATRTLDLTLFGLLMQSEDNVNFHVISNYDRLQRDFSIAEGVTLPAGEEYDFTRYRVNLSTANRRVLAPTASFEVGDFYSGDRQEVSLGLAVRPRRGVVVNMAAERNKVDLPEGEFTTRLYRVVTDTQFNPWIYLVNNLQYDSVSKNLGWQFRLRWTVDPGNDLYFVYTHNWLDCPATGIQFLCALQGEGLHTQDGRAAAKFVYTYRW